MQAVSVKPQAANIQYTNLQVRMEVMSDPTCCGVVHFGTFSECFKSVGDYPFDLANLRMAQSFDRHPLDAFKVMHPAIYKQCYDAWTAKLSEYLDRADADCKATAIFHFVKYNNYDDEDADDEDNDDFSPEYSCAVLREIVSSRPGAVNMGEYRNPNTGNIINGWCIPTGATPRIDIY